ncbi:hypothetical protein KC19_1G131000 [Ceratodon purpureus]|uniref:Phytocyanin domain-containing protein n=1 Tax=Ceratodon purpureus TaxID=3225 RepID=A0A8T0J5J0_CERPU|nr:hypothetical protein KC19_1G131000 [Ceratodon purpureus]
MTPMMQGRGSASLSYIVTVFVVAMSTFLGVSHAVQHVVGGDVQKWAFLQANSPITFYNDWAANQTFTTGDTMLFTYNNNTHSVVEVATQADFDACNLQANISKYYSGADSVFISKAGTSFFICGTPTHCGQGMKVSIVATGATVAAPPSPVVQGPAPAQSVINASPPAAFYSGVTSLALAILLTATHAAVFLG